MRHVPPQRAGQDVAAPELLIPRLTEDLERTIAFAEECRWRFPELQAEADELAEKAMALFSKSVRSLHVGATSEG